MEAQEFEDGAVRYQWASDADFVGIRLEALSDEGNVMFDVSIPDDGPVTVNTFGKEIPASLIERALEIARRPK